jgi:hypothetical protein
MLITLYVGGISSYRLSETSTVMSGMMASFTGNRTVGICKPNQLPIGFFIDDYSDSGFDPTTINIRVAVGTGEYQVDIFQPGSYSVNDLLYCGEDGIITNNTIYQRNPVVGIVNCVEDSLIGFISVLGNLKSLNKFMIEEETISPLISKRGFNRYTSLFKKDKK